MVCVSQKMDAAKACSAGDSPEKAAIFMNQAISMPL
jgi:hypothetical protein